MPDTDSSIAPAPSAANPIVVIPARLASTRLPDKPLADINGDPMIIHVWRRAMEAAVGPVLVAAAEEEIADVIIRAGGNAVLTDPDLPSGSDRCCAAVEKVDPRGDYNVVINLQGDLPALDPAVLRSVLTPLEDPAVDLGTLIAEIIEDEERIDPNCVKAVMSMQQDKNGDEGRQGRALYFTRSEAPYGDGPMWHHIGIYAFRRDRLKEFVGLAPSVLELRERLEQLRALENHWRIDAMRVDTVPLGVDTPADLEKMRSMLRPM